MIADRGNGALIHRNPDSRPGPTSPPTMSMASSRRGEDSENRFRRRALSFRMISSLSDLPALRFPFTAESGAAAVRFARRTVAFNEARHPLSWPAASHLAWQA